MWVYTVSLNSLEKAKRFADIALKYPNVDISLGAGKYLVDAKSILGILSLDLTKPLTLRLEALEEDMDEMEDFARQAEQYRV